MIAKRMMGMVLALTAILVSAPAMARDDTLYLPIKDVLSSEMAKEKLDGSVKFYFGGSGGGKILKAGVVSNRKTNAFGKSDEQACQVAMLSALIAFQETAKKMGATKVNNLNSYYKKNLYRSSTQYECHAGGFIAGVALRGDIAR